MRDVQHENCVIHCAVINHKNLSNYLSSLSFVTTNVTWERSRTSVRVLRGRLFESSDDLFQLEVIVFLKSKQRSIGKEVKESLLSCATGFTRLTDLLANRRSVTCRSVGALISRNSSINEPCRHCDISQFDWNEKVKIISQCGRGLGVMSEALAHLWPAPTEWQVEQLKADHWNSLTESVHKLLRLRS